MGMYSYFYFNFIDMTLNFLIDQPKPTDASSPQSGSDPKPPYAIIVSFYINIRGYVNCHGLFLFMFTHAGFC